MPLQLSQKQTIFILGGFVLLLVLGGLVYLNLRPASSTSAVTLTMWGVDSTKSIRAVTDAYVAANRGSQITYTQFSPDEYESKLISALAAGTGPDIFEVENSAMPRWQSVSAPLPASITTFNLTKLGTDFPNVVGQDFVQNGQIYALPFSIDTMAMIYNKDYFDAAGIAVVPKTWDDFVANIPALRQINTQGQITRAAVALGGSETSIAEAPDIISLLMLQNGTTMTRFGSGPGVAAFNYYLQFANAGSPYYTWNDGMGNALTSFIQGKTAVIFNYQAAMGTIKAKAPFLNVGIAPMLQTTGTKSLVNYPKYEGFAVSRSSPNRTSAWNFIIAITESPIYEGDFTGVTGGIPALRSAIAKEMGDPTLGVFASQALTARSWHQADNNKVNSIFNTAVQSVLNGSTDSASALSQAQASVNSL